MKPADKNNDHERETLVSYLDGELDEASTIEVENRLASDPDYRRRLQQLERTWDMLDVLPSVEPTESFTRSTLELVVQDAEKAVRRSGKRAWTVPIRAAILFAIPLLCFLGTYAILKWQQTVPMRKLIQDVPFLEKYELYESAGSIEFAEMLHAQGLFNEFAPNQEYSDQDEFVWEATPDYLHEMDADRRTELRRTKERFGQISEAEQKKWREFHDELVAHEDRDLLLNTLQQHHAWLQEVAPPNKPSSRQMVIALMDKSPTERIDEIRNLQRQQRQGMYGQGLAEADKEIVFKWFEDLVEEKGYEIRRKIRELRESNRRFKDRIQPQWTPEVLVRVLMQVSPQSVVEMISDEKFDKLLEQLSERSLKIIGEKESEQEKRKFVLLLNLQPYVGDEKLREFYYNELSAEDRSGLDERPPKEMREHLIRLYYQRKNNFSLDRRPRGER